MWQLETAVSNTPNVGGNNKQVMFKVMRQFPGKSCYNNYSPVICLLFWDYNKQSIHPSNLNANWNWAWQKKITFWLWVSMWYCGFLCDTVKQVRSRFRVKVNFVHVGLVWVLIISIQFSHRFAMTVEKSFVLVNIVQSSSTRILRWINECFSQVNICRFYSIMNPILWVRSNRGIWCFSFSWHWKDNR